MVQNTVLLGIVARAYEWLGSVASLGVAGLLLSCLFLCVVWVCVPVAGLAFGVCPTALAGAPCQLGCLNGFGALCAHCCHVPLLFWALHFGARGVVVPCIRLCVLSLDGCAPVSFCALAPYLLTGTGIPHGSQVTHFAVAYVAPFPDAFVLMLACVPHNDHWFFICLCTLAASSPSSCPPLALRAAIIGLGHPQWLPPLRLPVLCCSLWCSSVHCPGEVPLGGLLSLRCILSFVFSVTLMGLHCPGRHILARLSLFPSIVLGVARRAHTFFLSPTTAAPLCPLVAALAPMRHRYPSLLAWQLLTPTASGHPPSALTPSPPTASFTFLTCFGGQSLRWRLFLVEGWDLICYTTAWNP